MFYGAPKNTKEKKKLLRYFEDQEELLLSINKTVKNATSSRKFTFQTRQSKAKEDVDDEIFYVSRK
jgi:hypothetical protein